MDDTGLIIVETASIVVDVALAIGMAWIGVKQHQMSQYKTEIKANAEQIIKLELANHTSPLKASIDNLVQEIAGIHRRLEENDGDFKEIGDKRESMGMQLERRFGELRVFLAETFASKTDLKDHEKSVGSKFERMTTTTNDMAIQMAVLANKRSQ